MKIIVNTEQEKLDLIKAIEHIHYSDIDTDIPMVNKLAHLQPDDIIVTNEIFNNYHRSCNP
jgi:hypothetical protein